MGSMGPLLQSRIFPLLSNCAAAAPIEGAHPSVLPMLFPCGEDFLSIIVSVRSAQAVSAE